MFYCYQKASSLTDLLLYLQAKIIEAGAVPLLERYSCQAQCCAARRALHMDLAVFMASDSGKKRRLY